MAKGASLKSLLVSDHKELKCAILILCRFNYGFIPDTLSQDGDPIDAVIIMDDELVPGCYIYCKIIGVLETEDDAGVNPKLIMCPSTKVDPTYSNICDIADLPKMTLDKIKYFFMHYKDLENKKVTVGEFKGREEAITIYNSGIVCQEN
jgi:inorganic pyrophosphatase